MALFGRRTKPSASPVVGESVTTTDSKVEEARYDGNSPERSLPINIVSMMETFGRHEIGSSNNEVNPGDIWRNIVAPLMSFAQADSTAFLRALANAVLPVGGWAVYGGAHLVKEVLRGDLEDPSHHAMTAASLDFLRDCGLPQSYVLNGYESAFWSATKGKTEPWLITRPTPTPEAAPITELADGEMRRLAQLGTASDSNVFYVRRDPDGRYTAVIDAQWSDEDSRRVRRDWKTADSLYELYCEVAYSLQIPPAWFHSELEPYFPLPRPKIGWLPGQAS